MSSEALSVCNILVALYSRLGARSIHFSLSFDFERQRFREKEELQYLIL